MIPHSVCLVNPLANYVNGDVSGCANPPNLNKMALIDTAT